MINLKVSIERIAHSVIKTFKTFPAAMACALAFTLVTMVRIQLEWPAQEAYNFLFNCLHLGLAAGTILSLAAIAGVQTYIQTQKAFWAANGFGIFSAAVTCLLLYYFGADNRQDMAQSTYNYVSDIAAARVVVTILIGFLAMMCFTSFPKTRSSFSKALFMFEKAFFIALIYGLVMVLGASGVATAVEVLLYNDMSSKVYMYIGAVAVFLAFTVFAGYFPDFQKQEMDEVWETAQKQPRFIEVLFLNIMVPLMLVLTVVLLAWTAKTVLTQDWPSFIQLSGIAIGYAVGGIWLHIMVTNHQMNLADLYKKFYPVAAMVVLVFEAWALGVQMLKYGMKTTEYFFILVWVVTVVAVILLQLIKERSHAMVALIVCGAAVVSVLPFVGYQALPVQQQIHRLEGLLEENGLLQKGQLVPTTETLEIKTRAAITDAVFFLVYVRDAKLPAWLDKGMSDGSQFKKKLGFEPSWAGLDEESYTPHQNLSTYLNLPGEALQIKGYDWMVFPQQMKLNENSSSIEIQGVKGLYRVTWKTEGSMPPELIVEKDGQRVLKQSLEVYLKQLSERYPPGEAAEKHATMADLTYKIETPECSVLLVFNSITIDLNLTQDKRNYWVNLNGIYLKEK